MDVYIDTEEIEVGIDGITTMIRNLSLLMLAMKTKLETAHEDFTSINYQRTANSVSDANHSLAIMNIKLEMTNRYLGKLVEHIEAYHTLKF